MGTLVILGVRCPYCTKHRSPRDILHQPGGVTICVDCEQRHLEALAALGTGEFHASCSECGKTAEQLGPVDLRMAVHFENGKYRLMCMACDRVYVPKRKELYGKTEYGRRLGLGS
jgi:hypothetical protein